MVTIGVVFAPSSKVVGKTQGTMLRASKRVVLIAVSAGFALVR